MHFPVKSSSYWERETNNSLNFRPVQVAFDSNSLRSLSLQRWIEIQNDMKLAENLNILKHAKRM